MIQSLDRTIDFILQNRSILFIGAGISKIAGCYDWSSVVRELINHPDIKIKIQTDNIDGSKLSKDEWIEYCLRTLQRVNKENEYWGILRKAIQWDVVLYQKNYLPLVKNVKQIKPFPKVITTNIDDCLENTQLFNLSNIYYEPADFIIVNFNGEAIFHIHGYRDDLKNALWTRSSYISRYSDPTFKNFLLGVFSCHSIIFLGYGLSEIEIKNIIFEANSRNNNSDIEHFALIPTEDNLVLQDISVLKELYKINVITYGTRDELHNFLTQWVDKHFNKLSLKET